MPLADGNNYGLASQYQAVKKYRLDADASIELELSAYGMYILTSETFAGVSMLFQKSYSAIDFNILLDPNNVNRNYFKIEQKKDGNTITVTNLSSSSSCMFSINKL